LCFVHESVQLMRMDRPHPDSPRPATRAANRPKAARTPANPARSASEAKLTRIRRATLTLVGTRGMEGAPVALIARRAGVAVGTIYHHFRNKNELLRHLYLQVKHDVAREVLEAMQAPGEPKAQFRGIWERLIRYNLAHAAEFTFLQLFENSRLYTGALKAESMRAFVPITAALDAGVAAGLLRDIPREVMHSVILGCGVELCKQHLHGVLKADPPLVDAAFEACWRAIAAP
jgi:AcrR family transcriptional regulator